MKKLVLVVLFFLISAYAFSSVETFTYSSPEVQKLLQLSRLSKTPLLQMVYPVTSNYLLKMLETINVDKLSPESLKIYNSLKERLTNPPRLYKNNSVIVDANISLLVAQGILGEDIVPYNQMLPLLDLDYELGISDFFYGVFDLNFYPKQFEGFTSIGDMRLNSLLNTGDAQLTYPTRAYGSLGNDIFSFIIGRDRLSAGNGITGNLLFSENFLYEDFIKFSVYSGFLSYDFTAVSFNYWDFKDGNLYLHATDFNSASKMVFNHRVNSNIADILSLSIYEGAVSYSSNLLSSIKALNPFMMIHNTLTFYTGSVNNYFGFELNYPIIPNLEVNLNAFIDQIKLSTEEDTSGENTFGILFNAKSSIELSNKFLMEPYFEFMYGSPMLYLKEEDNYYYDKIESYKKEFYEEVINRNIDIVGDNNMHYENETKYIGYPYGGDVWVFALGSKFSNWSDNGLEFSFIDDFSVDLSFRSKGNYGIGVNEDRAVSLSHNKKPRENTLSINLGISGSLYRGIQYQAKLASVTKWNYQHTDTTKSDVQFGFYFNIKLDELISIMKRTYV